MRIIFLLSLLILSSCQDYNSNSSDKDEFGPSDLKGSLAFKKAYPVLQNRCATCHYHRSWSSYQDEQDWVSENLVIAGDARNSRLIIRTINTGTADSNMPQGGSALPSEEYSTLLEWIDGLQ